MDTAGGAQDTPLDLQVATPDGPCLWHSHPTIYAFGVHPGLRCPYYDYIKWVTWVLVTWVVLGHVVIHVVRVSGRRQLIVQRTCCHHQHWLTLTGRDVVRRR